MNVVDVLYKEPAALAISPTFATPPLRHEIHVWTGIGCSTGRLQDDMRSGRFRCGAWRPSLKKVGISLHPSREHRNTSGGVSG